jgi:L-threonylcarbamoyladenylate synthase
MNKIIKILKNGGIGVMPTDTLYGLVGNVFSKKAVSRIYKIKNRNKKKKLIVLISSINDLKKFKISNNLIRTNRRILKKVWPGRVSVVLNSVAFRLPAQKSLIKILRKTGPLVAPSANPEGLSPAQNIKEAKKYFGDKVDFYLAGGTLQGDPSSLIKINKKGEIVVLRGNIKL